LASKHVAVFKSCVEFVIQLRAFVHKCDYIELYRIYNGSG